MANNILASGVPRFNGGGNSEYLSFEYNSVIIGENSGKSLNLSASTIIRNYYNTFLGYGAGKNSSTTLRNTFLGFDAGTNVQSGSNNILLGKNYTNQQLIKLYDAIAVGLENNPGNASVLIGTSNMDYGYQNCIFGAQNHTEKSYQFTCIGINNTTSNISDSFIVGNNNTIKCNSVNSNIVLLGNNNHFSTINSENLLSSSPILIGNDLHQDTSNHFTINIGNTFLKYDNYNNREIIQLKTEGKYTCNVPVAIGFETNDISSLDTFIEESSNNSSLYVHSGIHTDFISFGSYDNSSNFNISISASSNLTSNIEYILPNYPEMDNVVLSTNEFGEMYWRQINLSDRTTDNLLQGTSNLYYNEQLVDARMKATFYDKFDSEFGLKMSQYNTDNIIIGTSNKFIENGIFNSDMYVFGTLTVNRLRVLGVDIKNDFGINDYIQDIVTTSIGELDDKIENLDTTVSNYIDIVANTPLNTLIKQYINTEISKKQTFWQKDLTTDSFLNINDIHFKYDVETSDMFRVFDIFVYDISDATQYSLSVVLTYTSLKAFVSMKCNKTVTNGPVNIDGNVLELTDVTITFTTIVLQVNIENNKKVSIISK